MPRCAVLFALLLGRPVIGGDDACSSGDNACSPEEGLSLLQVRAVRQASRSDRECLNAASWNTALAKQTPFRKYSQGDQDGILDFLFQDSHLGTTNKYFVEFGFHDVEAYSTANTAYLAEQGWTGLRMDGTVQNATLAASKYNLHQEFITSDNIVALFSKYDVPLEPDYVSVDIDSCDLWVFKAMTKKYRPRAFTVEYNAKYPVTESKTNRCKDKDGEPYSWASSEDDMYGASLAALYKAAAQAGYAMVAVDFKMDVFLVRKDLVCPGSEIPLAEFGHYAGYGFSQYRKGTPAEVERWVMDY